jgi:hypothetical protein
MDRPETRFDSLIANHDIKQAVNLISNMSTSMGAPAASARASSATIVAIIN